MCGVVKYAILDSKILCLTRDPLLPMTEHSHTCSPHPRVDNPQPQSLVNTASGPENCVSFVNHLNYEYLGEWAV